MTWIFAFFCTMAAAQSFGRLGPYGLHGAELQDAQNWLAIVGDSGITGAASSPDIEPTISSLFTHIFDFIKEAPLVPHAEEPMTRVLYSRQEYREAGGLFGSLFLNAGAKLSLRLDVPENSLGYRVGRQLGIAARDIVLVGQDGVQVKTIAAQFARIFEMKTTTLPPLVLVSYTANDLCDERVFSKSVAEWAAEFKMALDRTWSDAGPFLKAHARGTQVLVLAPFDVANVITNPGILAQPVNVEGQGEITCGQLRSREAHFSPSAWLVLRMLNLMCPSVTQTHPGDAQRLAHLRAVQEAFGEAWQIELSQLNALYGEKGLRFVYAPEVRDLEFTQGDVGHDCFHPSQQGHNKLAQLLLNRLQN